MSNIIYLAGNHAPYHSGRGEMMKRGQAARKEPSENTLSLLNNRVVDNLERFLKRRPDLDTQKAIARELKVKPKSVSYISNLLARRKGVSLDKVEQLAALFKTDPGLFLLDVRHSVMLEAFMEKEK